MYIIWKLLWFVTYLRIIKDFVQNKTLIFIPEHRTLWKTCVFVKLRAVCQTLFAELQSGLQQFQVKRLQYVFLKQISWTPEFLEFHRLSSSYSSLSWQDKNHVFIYCSCSTTFLSKHEIKLYFFFSNIFQLTALSPKDVL